MAPINRSGGFKEHAYTPSTDGNFDPISLEIDPTFGNLSDYRRLVQAAQERASLIIANLVALHTSQGPDFLLALLGHAKYRNLYMMVEIPKEDWNLLPPESVVGGSTPEAAVPSAPVSKQQAEELTTRHYIPGLINSCDATVSANEHSGWSATGVI